MRFWDSSAIVPLVVKEESSRQCRAWLRRQPTMLVWCLASAEVLSALARENRESAIEPGVFRAAKKRLAQLEEGWSEVVQWEDVRARARRLLEGHALRAADALHLAAALVAFEERTVGVEFVTFDERLAGAASSEGFSVLPETP